MSASREKKQRQNTGPSVRDARTQQEEAAYRKKVHTYTAIGAVVAVLVAALLIWDTGIFDRGRTAVTVGDTKYSVADLSYFYQNAKYDVNQFYYMAGMSSYVPADSDVQDKDSGKTWREYYLDLASENMTQVTALYDEALNNGWTEADVADDVDAEIEDAKSAASASGYGYGKYLQARYSKYMTADSFKAVVTRAALANAYRRDHHDGLTYSDADIEAYYDEHKDSLDTFEYSFLYFTPETVDTKDEDGNDLEEDKLEELRAQALADAKEKADAALAALEDGSSTPAKLVKEYELSDSSSAVETTSVGSSLTSAAYSETLYQMEEGESSLVENGESGYYVVTLHSRTRLEDPTRDTRHILLTAEATADDSGNVTAPTEEAWNSAKQQADQALSEYKSGEQTAEAFGALAEKYSVDGGSNTNGGLYEGVYPGQFVSEYDEWLFDSARKSGDVEIIRHEDAEPTTNSYFGYHVVYYVGENDPVWKLTVVDALRSADTNEWLDGLKEGFTASLEGGADLI